MYCTHCGAQLPDHAAFCPQCGTAVSFQTSSDRAYTTAPTESSSFRVFSKPTSKTRLNGSSPIHEEAILGKNQTYYQSQFQKIRAGQKANFNWAAFFLGLYHAAYRGVWKEWLSFMKLPLLGSVAAFLFNVIGVTQAYYSLVSIGSVLSTIFGIINFAWSISYGFAFNQLYLNYVESQDTADPSSLGPSVKRVLIALGIIVILGIISVKLYGLSEVPWFYDYYSFSTL